ncbi:MAG: patatin-like phospholipase family protein [Pseudomonadota bacterium]
MAKATSESVGVVFVGAGARGAYEAGAFAELLPVLEAHGRRPTVFVGTSAGAINAVLFASFAHLPAQEAADRVLALWRQVEREQVIRPVLPSGLVAVARYLAQVAGLNAPIKPAIALGVDRIILLATDPIVQTASASTAIDSSPDVYAAIAGVLHNTLVDRMVEDVRTLGKINELLNGSTQEHSALRASYGKRGLRPIPYLFVGTSRAGDLGQLAREVFQARYGSGRWLRRALDFPVLNQLLGGSRKTHGELLSYLFFEPEFIQRAITMGQQDAQRLLAQAPDGVPWRMTT